jgi:hypothetical protein
MVPRCTSRRSPERTVPSFYRKLGFQLTGEKSEGQAVGVLDLTNA